MGSWLGRALGGVVGKVVTVLVPGLLIGLVTGLGRALAAPVASAATTTKRKWRRGRDRSAVKRDWKALRKGRFGRRGKDVGKRTRRRIAKRKSGIRR